MEVWEAKISELCKVVTPFAEELTDKLTGSVIKELKAMASFAPDDSALKNCWEDICVQVQGEESGMWNSYVDTIEQFIEKKLGELKGFETSALWLQTDEGSAWEFSEEKAICVCDDDMVDYIMGEILSRAADFSNSRIEKMLESEMD